MIILTQCYTIEMLLSVLLTFLCSTSSDHENFNGEHPSEVTVGYNEIQTILVSNLMVPSTVKAGNRVSLTLTVTKVGGDQSVVNN